MYPPGSATTSFYSSALAAVMPGAVQPSSAAGPVDGPLLRGFDALSLDPGEPEVRINGKAPLSRPVGALSPTNGLGGPVGAASSAL